MTFTLIDVGDATLLCVRCGEPIAQVAMRRYSNARRNYHVECAIDVDADLAQFSLTAPSVQFADSARLLALADARIAAEQDANRLRKKSKESASIEPARDPKGRPRVRVVCVHSSDGSSRAPSARYFNTSALDEDRTICSSIREYVIVPHASRADLRINPSQPWVAAMYWQDAGATVSPGNAKLVEWNALQLPSPVLVIVGDEADDPEKRDKIALKLRALVSKSGFNPDECPVVYGSRPDSAFRERLLLALDEHSTQAKSSNKERNAERVADTLDTLIAEGRDEALVLAITSAAKAYRGARAQEKERTLAAIQRALVAHPKLSDKVLAPLLRSGVALSRERVTPILRAMIALPQLPERTEDWLRLWRSTSGDTRGLAPLVRANIEAEPESNKSARLRWLFDRVGLSLEGE